MFTELRIQTETPQQGLTFTINTFAEVLCESGQVKVLVVHLEDTQQGVDVQQDERQRHGEGLHHAEAVGQDL